MSNLKEKRVLQKFSFKKEIVSKLNENELNSIKGGAVTESTVIFCGPGGFTDVPCIHGPSTDHTECYCSGSAPCNELTMNYMC